MSIGALLLVLLGCIAASEAVFYGLDTCGKVKPYPFSCMSTTPLPTSVPRVDCVAKCAPTSARPTRVEKRAAARCMRPCVKDLMETKPATWFSARAFCSTGKPDDKTVFNIKNARDNGMESVDIYIFPAPNKYIAQDRSLRGEARELANGRAQVAKMIDTLDPQLKALGEKYMYNRIWLDIEGASKGKWSQDKKLNMKFVEGMALECIERGKKVGVYTSKRQWELILGDAVFPTSATNGKQPPLWYPVYGRAKDYFNTFAPVDWSDAKKPQKGFQPFGGFDIPAMKQYKGTTKMCKMRWDFNWSPYTLAEFNDWENLSATASGRSAPTGYTGYVSRTEGQKALSQDLAAGVISLDESTTA